MKFSTSEDEGASKLLPANAEKKLGCVGKPKAVLLYKNSEGGESRLPSGHSVSKHK